MSDRLAWDFLRHDQIADLHSFTCARTSSRDSRGQRVYPKWWEREAEMVVRGYRWRPRSSCLCLVGCDEHGIAAASVYTQVDRGATIDLEAMALAIRYRKGEGVVGAIADEMVGNTLDVITTNAIELGLPEVVVTGYVWHENRASQRMCERNGFQCVGEGSPGVQQWSILLDTRP